MTATSSEAAGGHHDATSGAARGGSMSAPSPAPPSRAEGARSSTSRIPSVRRATYADLATVVELRLALLREHGNHAVYGRLRADARERAYEVFGSQLRSPTEVMLLAERDGEVVGVLRCVDTPNSPLLYPDRYCYVSSVYVRPGARRAGVLKALLRQARAWCAERGLREMRLHNVPDGIASAAWEAEGFSVIEQVRIKTLDARD